MKKLLTLILALALVFGLTVPAMAFTSDTEEDDDSIPFELSIYLVEYDDNDFFGITTLPESDRGYAKNEIVAAVVELYIPEDEVPSEDYYDLVFGGDNVDLDVTDNAIDSIGDAELACAGFSYDTDEFYLNDDDELVRYDNAIFPVSDDDETYKWLFFAKVTDDDASLYAKLIDGYGNIGFEEVEDEDEGEEWESLIATLDGTTYTIILDEDIDDEDAWVYLILWTDDDGVHYGIMINTDEDYKSTGMSIGINDGEEYDGDWMPLGVNTEGELGLVKGAVVDTDGDDFDDIMDVYEDVVVDVFGLDYFNIGNYVRKSFFEDLVSADTLIATVDIEPWTAYVVVPDNIVVDPPKTGDAASIVGFVMVALAGGSAVALKKRG